MRRRRFLASGIAALATPALVPQPVRAAFGGMRNAGTAADPIRLSSNENPLGAPESARRAMTEAFDLASRYPRYDEALAAAIAGHHGVRPENVVLGAGSTDVLRMAVQLVAARDGRIVIADPTFEHVANYALPFSVRAERISLLAGSAAHDLGRMRDAATDAMGPVLVFLCNPNNPTGTLTPLRDIETWIRDAPEDVLFLVDEAYFDYVEDPSYRTFIPDALRQPNVLVSRTFSKIFALAGLRVGYGLAHAETAARLRAFAGDSNVNQLALVAALAALEDDAFVERSLRVNREARGVLENTLDALEIERLPSHTNFLMHRITGDLVRYNERMRDAGVLVGRPFPPMLGWSRVSLGTVAEMELHSGRLREFRVKGWV